MGINQSVECDIRSLILKYNIIIVPGVLGELLLYDGGLSKNAETNLQFRMYNI